MKQNVKREIDHVVTAFSLFCDDVRLETSGKLCFIGQYPGDILVAGLQTPIDRIAIVTFARWKKDQPVKSLAARTEVPGLAPLISQMATFPIGTNVMDTVEKLPIAARLIC